MSCLIHSQVCDLVFEKLKTQSKPIEFLAVQWIRKKDQVKQISLRSLPGSSLDVSAIARINGGNGHKTGAGVQNQDTLK